MAQRRCSTIGISYLGEEQYYKALLEVSGERMNEQPDKPELADIAKDAKNTVVKRKRGRPPITGPQEVPPSPVITAALIEWQQRQGK